MSKLAEICDRKRAHVAEKKKSVPLSVLQEKIKSATPPAGFIKALKNHKAPAIIAEVKKASPSRGIIRADFNPVAIAKIYESSGAACISVLTDEPYFQGHDDYLRDIKNAVKIPALRKDFMIDPYQIYESRALGADCILLIMAALEDPQAAGLYALSTELGMDVLVEVHDEQELDRAIELNPAMIGVNNRSLKTLKVDIQTSHKLITEMPKGIVKVAESGIDSPETIKALQKAGFDAFLIGESLMKERDIGNALTRFYLN